MTRYFLQNASEIDESQVLPLGIPVGETEPVYDETLQGWRTQDMTVSDPMREFTVTTKDSIFQKSRVVSVAQFKILLFPEIISIKAAREGDPTIDMFFDITEDLSTIDLNSDFCRAALNYLISAELISADRVASIIAAVQ